MLYHLFNGEQVIEPQPFPGEDICVLIIDSTFFKVEVRPFNQVFTIAAQPGLYAIVLASGIPAVTRVDAISIPNNVYDVAQLDDLVTVLYVNGDEIRYRKLIIDRSLSECAVLQDGIVSLNDTSMPALESTDTVRIYNKLKHDGFSSQCYLLSSKQRVHNDHPLRPRGVSSITTFHNNALYDIEFINGVTLYRREYKVHVNADHSTLSLNANNTMLWTSEYEYKTNIASIKVHGDGVLFVYAKINNDGTIDSSSFKLEYVIGDDVYVKDCSFITT